MKLNLQRFAEDDEPIVIDNVIDDDELIDDPEPGTPEPLPGSREPEPTPAPAPMPSGVPTEAWRNVEELLVTLSNNTRVNIGELRDDIKRLTESGRATNEQIIEALNRLNGNMEQFTELVRSATVEQEPGQPNHEEPKEEETKPKRRGFAGRKRS